MPERNWDSVAPSAVLKAISIDPSVCWSAASWSRSSSPTEGAPNVVSESAVIAESYVHDQLSRRV